MKNSRRCRFGVAAFVVTAVIGSGCNSSTSTNSEDIFAGRYIVAWSLATTTCVPQPLPTPLNTDTSQYTQLPQAPVSMQTTVQIDHSGDSLSLAPLSASGSPISAEALSGHLDMTTGPVLLSRSATRVEGPRAGGHTFYVVEARADSLRFFPAVETPPGNRTEVDLIAQGTATFTFRENSASGSTFTTCSFTETITGSKI